MTGKRAMSALLLLLGACQAETGGIIESAVTPEGYEQAAAALDSAISAKDAATLERLVAEDFLWIRGNGAKGDKAAFIEALTSPSIRIEPFRPSDVRWILEGNAALLTATNSLRGSLDGEAFLDRHHFADHWLWRDGRWRLVYAQVTPAAQPGDTR